VGRAGELVNVAVWVSGARSALPAPAAEVSVEQQGCRFQPRVQVVQAGQVLAIRNNDFIEHHLRAVVDGEPAFEAVQRPGAPPLHRKLPPAAGQVLTLGCTEHPWTKSFLVVSDSPYAAVTGEDGRFTLAGVAPGTYTVFAWHEKLGIRTAQATVGTDVTTVLRFAFGELPVTPSPACVIATKDDGPVARACHRGGVKAAKAAMKTMLKAARDRGLKLECDDCHKDENARDFALRDDARGRFEAMLRSTAQ